MPSLRQFNKIENELAKKYPEETFKTKKLAIQAIFEEGIRYKDDGEDGNNSNAFLHTYWSALLARNISEQWANEWTDAHEKFDMTIYGEMDRYNNRLGIQYGIKFKHLSDEDLANEIELIIDIGEAKVIKEGKLVPSSNSTKRNDNVFKLIEKKAYSLLIKLISQTSDLQNADGMTPLIFCASSGDLRATQIVLPYSNKEIFDNFGDNSLIHSVRSGQNDVVKVLVESGVDINATNRFYGRTALMEAVECNHVSIAKYLKQRGANHKIKNRSGMTAYDLAKLENLEKTYDFLKC